MTPPAKSHHHYVSFDKTPIHYIHYHPKTDPLANLLIIHGAGEYGERYEPFSDFLSSSGIGVYAMDLRGYGQSGGRRAYAKSMMDFANDIHALVIKIARDQPLPLYLLGHSFGGIVATYTAAQYPQDRFAGLLLSSPCYGISLKIPIHLRIASRIFALIYPGFRHKVPPHPEILSHDKKVVDSHARDERIVRMMTSRLYGLLQQTMRRMPQIAQNIQCPVWLGYAGIDLVVDSLMTESIFPKLASDDKTLCKYEGFFHEILNESDRQKVYDDILNWIKSRLTT